MDGSGSRTEQMAGVSESGFEPSSSTKCREFRLAEELSASQEGLCSMELVTVVLRQVCWSDWCLSCTAFIHI